MKAIPLSNGFVTAFQAPVDERRKLLDFLQFLTSENVYESISRSPFSPAEPTWRHWAANTFVGFSSESVLLKSGFSFELSQQTNNPAFGNELRTSRTRMRLRHLKHAMFPHLRAPNHPDEVGLTKALHRHYPNLAMPESDRPLMEHAPLQYVLGREMIELMSRPRISRLLEIGAGKGIHVALQLLRNPGAQVTVVDLPETLFVTYISLRQILPDTKIYLPNEELINEEKSSYIRLIMPNQINILEPDSFDAVVNMNSFQEMAIDVVNAYIALALGCLKRGKSLHSCNHAISRHVAGNSAEAYRFDGFTSRSCSLAPLHTDLARQKNGLGGEEHVHLRAIK